MRISAALSLCLLGLSLGACRVQEAAQSPDRAQPLQPQQPAQPQAPAQAQDPGAPVPMASAAASEAAGPKLKPAAQACATDSDCFAIANYCGGCRCEVANAQETRKCKDGEQVACLADPCMNKQASCQQGRCQLQDSAGAPQ